MADADRFDPRFDPAFQRGFEGEAEPVSRPAAFTPEARPVVEQPREVVERVVETDSVERAARRAPERRPEALDAAPQRRNPFLIAALVIAGLLIVGGILIFARLPEWRAIVQGEAVVDFAILQTLYFAAPLMVTLGVATIIAVLLIAAVRWRGAPVED